MKLLEEIATEQDEDVCGHNVVVSVSDSKRTPRSLQGADTTSVRTRAVNQDVSTDSPIPTGTRAPLVARPRRILPRRCP